MGGSSSSSTTQKSTNFNNMGNSSGGLAGNINQTEGSSLDIQNLEQTDFGATKQAGKTARKALDANKETVTKGMDLAERLGKAGLNDVADARDSAEMMFKTSQGAMKDINRRTLQQMQQSNDRAMAFAAKASKSETTQLAENMQRYGAYAVGGLALAIFLANRG